MIADKVLRRMELENRKIVLITASEIIQNELTIKTNRGIYVVNKSYIYPIWNDINKEIREINTKLDELTGLNNERLKLLNKAGE